jgi:branched-chain amino acid transport system permease protein
MTLRLALKLIAFAAAAAIVFFLPRLVSDFRALQLATVGIYFIALLGLNLLTGYSGQISLGHGAFMGVGGYAAAILIVHHHVSPLAAIPLGGLVAGVAGFLFGIPALRLSGLYLALATFGVAVSFDQLVKKAGTWRPFGVDLSTGGSGGLFPTPLTPHFGQSFDRWLYYVCWGFAAVLFLAAWALASGRIGRALLAIRDSEVAAASSGVSLAGYKTFAFGVSAFYAGVAGALFVLSTSTVFSGNFPISLSIFLVAGLVVGGLGSLTGTLAGAAFIYYLRIYAPNVLHLAERIFHFNANDQAPGVPSVIFGLVLIAVVLVLPGGTGQLLRLPGTLWELTKRRYAPSKSEPGPLYEGEG